MAIEIRVESTWDTDDGEGRRIEVTVAERRHPAEDLLEDTRYFASGDLPALMRYLAELVGRKESLFEGPRRRECIRCGRVLETDARGADFLCEDCRSLAG